MIINTLGHYENTLGPGDYDSFAAAILSQNHREIDIAKSILLRIVFSFYVTIKAIVMYINKT